MPIKSLVIIFILLPFGLFSQVIKGVVSGYDGKAIAFATIYVEELQTGTSANQQGRYEIHVNPGTYTISFRSMGFTPQTKTVIIKNDNVSLNIKLNIQSYILTGVTVRADSEDPAYSIMRKAIARVPGFINQAKSYSSEVYIKGSVKASKIPKILQKRMTVNGEAPKVGETYVNESINRIRFEAPDNYVQEVISVNNSFPIGDDDVPVIQMISGSIYESQDDLYISPFSPNAFSHYNFRYDGLLQDGAWFIDKIRVIPKRKSKLLMDGYVYIVEDLWCLYSYDMLLNPPYVELKMRQHYVPIKGNNYFPVNLFAEAKISIMGIKANATYVTTIKYDSVVINSQFSHNNIKQTINYDDIAIVKEEQTLSVENSKVTEIDNKLEELYESNELTNREMVQMQKLMAKKAILLKESELKEPLEIVSTYKQVVKKDALVRDSIYWDSIRPVPASAEEKISYNKVVEKEEKEDSTSTFVKALKIAAFGNYEWERSRKFYTYYPGLFATRNVGFNPIDGLQLKQSIKIRWKYDSISFAEFKGKIGYAWERQKVFGDANLWITYNPLKRGSLSVSGGYLADDYQGGIGINENLSAAYNLFLKETYIKYYNNTYIDVNNHIDIANGTQLYIGGKWQETDTLSNNTEFSFLYPNKLYDHNTPVNDEITDNNLNPSNLISIRTGVTFTPRHYYRISKGKKSYIKSKWPTFGLFYTYAIPINSNYSQYHFLNFSVDQKVDFYGVSSIKYKLNTGMYMGTKNVHFSNFKHFKTIAEPFTTRNIKNDFFLLNNYEYSTSKKFFEGHFQYSTQFLILKRLPWISNQLWTENLFFNCLYVEGHRPYYETGYSVGQIFFQGEIGVFAGFKGSEFHGVGIKAIFDIDN